LAPPPPLIFYCRGLHRKLPSHEFLRRERIIHHAPQPASCIAVLDFRTPTGVKSPIMILHAVVLGRVQGVGFRCWLLEEARRLGLTGWVRNQRDGGVEIEAEGDEDKLFRLEQLLWEGPALAHVTEVRARYIDAVKNYPNFTISY
jgi:acylphosphatase